MAKTALEAGATLLLDSDAHTDSDLLTEAFAGAVLRGAGLDKKLVPDILNKNPQELLKKLIKINQ